MSLPTPEEIARRVPAPIVGLCQSLSRAGFEAWLVGGAIRDLLLRRPHHDYDIATSAHPEQVAKVFGKRRTIPTGAAHGTVTVLLDRPRGGDGPAEGVEVTTFRGEGAYSDGRRPDSVAFVSDLVEDLRRRDFTINAIALDPLTGRLADPFDGRPDLLARLVRAVGDPRERFAEDGLRIMRAVRIATQLAFRLDPATEEAIPGAIPIFRKVSMERIRDELLKLLAASRPSEGLRLMAQTGLLAEVLPEVAEGIGVGQNRFHAHDVFEHTLHTVDETRSPRPRAPDEGEDPILRAAALLHDVAKPRTAAPREDAPAESTFYRHEQVGATLADAIGRRLKLSNRDRERVVALVEQHMFWYTAEWSDGAVRRFISRTGTDLLPDLFALREADVRARGRGEDPDVEVADLRRRVERELSSRSALKVTDLAIGGGDVIRLLGRPPGPIVGEILRRILDRVLDAPALNERAALEALVPQLAAEIDAEATAPPKG